MAQNKNNSCKAVELRSEEVQEVMNRIPPAIVRWGMTIMTIIVTGLLFAATFIPWPETIECMFEWHDGNEPYIKASLSPETLKLITSERKCNVFLYSPMFNGEYSNKTIPCIITNFTVEDCKDNNYIVQLNISLPKKNVILNGQGVGTILIIITNKTLFQYIIEHKI